MRSISIHALLAESDVLALADACPLLLISIHALLAESDLGAVLVFNGRPVFLSTLSLRRATVFNLFANPGSTISIHALLAESDR